MSDRGAPRGEQHLHDGARPGIQRLTPELVGRQFFEPDLAANYIADHAHLLRLAQRLWAGEDVVASRVSVVVQDARRHRGDVALVDRCGLSRPIGPADDVTLTDGPPPPELGV